MAGSQAIDAACKTYKHFRVDGSGLDQGGGSVAGRLPRPVRGVVFDLDGTLLDTEGPYRDAFTEALRELGATLPRQAYESLIGLSAPARRAILPSLLGDAFPVADFYARYRHRRTARLAGGVRLKPGAAEALDLLDRLGLPRAIATSASAATAQANLDAAGIAGRFDTVLTRDDVANGKPAPDIFLAAATSLGVAPRDCLALEDSPHGVQAAWAAGLMTVMVPDLLPATPVLLRCCAALIGSLRDVPALLNLPGRATELTKNRFRLRV